MTNIYYDIVNYENDDFEEYLRRILIYDVFKNIIEEYADTIIAKKVIRYILYAYSMDSEMLSPNGNNWSKVSEQILEVVGLPIELYDDVLLLQNQSVLLTIQRWLQYQNNEMFTNYITYRDLRREMLASSLSKIKAASDEINYEQKMKNAIHAGTLLQMMNEAMESFIQNHPKLKASAETLNRANNKNKVTRSVADYAISK